MAVTLLSCKQGTMRTVKFMGEWIRAFFVVMSSMVQNSLATLAPGFCQQPKHFVFSRAFPVQRYQSVYSIFASYNIYFLWSEFQSSLQLPVKLVEKHISLNTVDQQLKHDLLTQLQLWMGGRKINKQINGERGRNSWKATPEMSCDLPRAG